MRNDNKHSGGTELLFTSLNWIRNTAVIIVFLAIGLLVYIPFQDSIHQSFEPRPAHVKASTTPQPDLVKDGIHIATGLRYDQNFTIVKNACTSCHSGKLIAQNRATRAGWEEMISWMQKTQGLPDLGRDHTTIVDYLAEHYAPEEVGRRKQIDLAEVEWYILEL